MRDSWLLTREIAAGVDDLEGQVANQGGIQVTIVEPIVADVQSGMGRQTRTRRPGCWVNYCCFSQNDSRPCDAEPPMTQGIPISTCPSAAAETQPSAIAPTPTCPQKLRSRRASDPLVFSSSTAASASLRTAPSCTVSAA